MRHGIVVCAFVLVSGLLLGGDLEAGSLEPPGPPAPTMKTIQQVEPRVPISSLPVVIAAPGNYYLTGDLTGVAGVSGINVNVSLVTIDLNGFSLTGVPGSLDGIFVSAAARQVEIRNGVIRNWAGRGISAGGASEIHVQDLRVDSNGSDGVRVGPRSIVRHTTSMGNGGNGFIVETGSLVVECTAAINTISGVVAGANSVVSGTTATGHTNNIGFSLATGSLATDCTAQGNFFGFSLTSGGTRVVRSVARANNVGIFGGDAVTVEECSAEGNNDDGIRVSNRGLVRDNIANNNINDGIQSAASTRIEGNVVSGNGVGIRVVGINNLVVRNSAVENVMEYAIVGGNKVGTISVDPTTAGPWANFDQ